MGKHYDPLEGFDNENDDGGDEPEGVDLQVEKVLQERDKALQVVLLDTGDVRWIPKSVIHSDSEVFAKPDAGTGAGKRVVHMWFAEQEGLV